MGRYTVSVLISKAPIDGTPTNLLVCGLPNSALVDSYCEDSGCVESGCIDSA